MFNSTVLDVVIGLVFCYAFVALAASSINEAFSSIWKWRAKTLLAGVKDLLNDPDFTGLAQEIYGHALVNPLCNGKNITGKLPDKLPSYIPASNFANALIDTLQTVPGDIKAIGESIDKIGDKQLCQMLKGFYKNANGDMNSLEKSIADWFDNGMDRLSGNYKRKTQLWLFLIALVLAGLLNIDSFFLFSNLWRYPSLTSALANPDATQTISATLQQLQKLPIGWEKGGLPDDGQQIALMVCGWLVTASSALFGSSFWFDLLKRFVHLRGTGKKPLPVVPLI